jgi:hypothetical protein
MPQPLHRPRIMIGGGGERKTLRLVAQYADACNLFVNRGSDPAVIQHKLDVLGEHCQTVGTDFGRIRKTLLWTGDPTPNEAFVQALAPYAAMGFSQVHVMPPGAPMEYIEALGRNVVTPLAQLG